MKYNTCLLSFSGENSLKNYFNNNMCGNIFICNICNKFVDLTKRIKIKQIILSMFALNFFCSTCDIYVEQGHFCFIKKYTKEFQIIFMILKQL